MSQTISEDDHVVLMKSFDHGNMKIIPASRGKIVHYGKLHFDPTPLIGSQFGSVFEIKDQTMTLVDNFEDYDNHLSTLVTEKLNTFNEKSQFSREKIIKKKKKQNHSNIVTVIRPTLILINEMLYARDKIGGLRPDILSQIITSSNIQNGSKCLILDHNLGLLTSAVMSRILPDGVCIQLMPDPEAIATTRKTLEMLNIDSKQCQNKLLAITIRDFYKVCKRVDNFSYENDIRRARGDEHLNRLSALTLCTRDQETGEKKVIEEQSSADNLQNILMKKDSNREMRNRERTQAAQLIKAENLDSIILIAQNEHPLNILKMTYPFLLPSRQFVIYSDIVDPLLECHQYLKSNCLAVSLNLSESWLRRYQVLPDRTRPEMNLSGFGGYLLSGTKALYGPEYDAVDTLSLDTAASM